MARSQANQEREGNLQEVPRRDKILHCYGGERSADYINMLSLESCIAHDFEYLIVRGQHLYNVNTNKEFGLVTYLLRRRIGVL